MNTIVVYTSSISEKWKILKLNEDVRAPVVVGEGGLKYVTPSRLKVGDVLSILDDNGNREIKILWVGTEEDTERQDIEFTLKGKYEGREAVEVITAKMEKAVIFRYKKGIVSYDEFLKPRFDIGINGNAILEEIPAFAVNCGDTVSITGSTLTDGVVIKKAFYKDGVLDSTENINEEKVNPVVKFFRSFIHIFVNFIFNVIGLFTWPKPIFIIHGRIGPVGCNGIAGRSGNRIFTRVSDTDYFERGDMLIDPVSMKLHRYTTEWVPETESLGDELNLQLNERFKTVKTEVLVAILTELKNKTANGESNGDELEALAGLPDSVNIDVTALRSRISRLPKKSLVSIIEYILRTTEVKKSMLGVFLEAVDKLVTDIKENVTNDKQD